MSQAAGEGVFWKHASMDLQSGKLSAGIPTHSSGWGYRGSYFRQFPLNLGGTFVMKLGYEKETAMGAEGDKGSKQARRS